MNNILPTQWEFIPETDENWNLTWNLVDRKKAHSEWIPHLSVHIWCIDTERFKDSNDIWIHLSMRSKEKSDIWTPYLQRTAWWHISWESEFDKILISRKDKDLLSLKTALKECAEELWIVIENIEDEWEMNSLEIYSQKVANELIWVLKIWDNLWDIWIEKWKWKVKLLFKNRSYWTIRSKMKNWKQIVDNNIEHVDIYAIEYNKQIIQFDRWEIDWIDVYPSKQVLIMLDDYKLFWWKDEQSWKDSKAYNTMKDVILKLQTIYWIK